MPLTLQNGNASLTLDSRQVEASTGWSHASIPLALETHELPRLADGLEKLIRDECGSFLWTNDGGEVQIEIVMAKRGETHWSVRLQAPPDFLHELRLVFIGRQDDLPALAAGLLGD